MIDRIISQFDRWSVPKLEQIADRIDFIIEELKAAPVEPLLSELDTELAAWDHLSQPVQLWEQAKGLDEPRSLALSRKIRQAAVELANDAGQHEAALHITRSLVRTFAELPTVVAESKKDLATLEELVEASRAQRVIMPLHRAADVAEGNLGRTSQQVLQGSFAAEVVDEVGNLYTAFAEAKARADELADPDMPWLIVRSVALTLHNDAQESEAARIIVVALLDDAPAGPRQRLEEDLKTLQSLRYQREFAAALQNNDLGRARQIVSDMVAQGHDDQGDLLKVRTDLDDAITRRNWKRVGWGAAATVVLFLMITEGNNRPASTYDNSPYMIEPTPYRSDSIPEIDSGLPIEPIENFSGPEPSPLDEPVENLAGPETGPLFPDTNLSEGRQFPTRATPPPLDDLNLAEPEEVSNYVE